MIKSIITNTITCMDALTMSTEQQKIIQAIIDGKSVVVDAVAGSGKTTTVLFTANKNPNKRILQLTYNKALKDEVRQKIIKYKIDNVTVHNYHGLATKYYYPSTTDSGIIEIIRKDLPLKYIDTFDIVIVDEAQDMTPNYYSLIYKFLIDQCFTGVLMILGDKHQGIFEFKNADSRFLTMARSIWSTVGKREPLKTLTLKHSYRVTDQIAFFVNHCMLGDQRIVSNKRSLHPVHYYKEYDSVICVKFYRKICGLIESGYVAEDIFVLAPSLKNRSVKKLENLLAESSIPVHYPRDDQESINDLMMTGKVVFSTFHQSKGRERPIVFVFGFDESYFNLYSDRDGTKDRTICPPELYVAVTRASEILFVVEDIKNKPLPFLSFVHPKLLENVSVYTKSREATNSHQKKKEEYRKISVTILTKFISEENNEMLLPLLDKLFEQVRIPSASDDQDLIIPSFITTTNGLIEDISDLNGLVVPALWEASRCNVSTIQQYVENHFKDNIRMIGDTAHIDERHVPLVIRNYVMKYIISHDTIDTQYHLCLTNLYIALTESIYSKLIQISHYNWLTDRMVARCHKYLDKYMGRSVQFEVALGELDFIEYNSDKFGKIFISGRLDAVDETTVWEIKCTSEIKLEHQLQLVVYSWIYNQNMIACSGKKKFKIINIMTGEILKLKYNFGLVEQVVGILLDNKYGSQQKKSDNLFIEKCKSVQGKYLIKNVVRHDDADECETADNRIPTASLFRKILTVKQI